MAEAEELKTTFRYIPWRQELSLKRAVNHLMILNEFSIMVFKNEK